MRYKTPPRHGHKNRASRLKRALCICVPLRACVLLAAVLAASGCVGATFGVSTLEPKWQLGGSYAQVGASAFMPMTGSDLIMPEFGGSVGFATGDELAPLYVSRGDFTELYAGMRIFAAPYEISGNMGNTAMQTAVPYVGAGVTLMQATLEDIGGNSETANALGLYVRAGMSMGEFFSVEGRYLIAPSVNLFGQDLDLSGAQASVWIRFDAFLFLMMFLEHH